MKLLNKLLRYALIAVLYCTHNSPFVLANHTHFNNVGFPSNSRYDSSPTSLFSDSPKTIEPLPDYRSDANLPKDSHNNSDEEHNDEFKDEQRHSERHSDGSDYDHVVNTDDCSPTEPKTNVTIIERTELPEDSDSWRSIQKERRIYVDKTKFLLHFVDKESKLYFSGKPRRFGKTCFLQMVRSYFLAEKELFRGLYIFNVGNTPEKNGMWVKYPVIHITLGGMFMNKHNSVSEMMSVIGKTIRKKLRRIASQYGVDGTTDEMFSLEDLISELYSKYQLPVVVLIDEYDNLLNEAIKISKELSKEVLDYLNTFYVQIKNANGEDMIKLAWVTGVHKHAINSLESGPNSFTDVSWDSNFATSVGFTKHEIETTFKHKILEFAAHQKTTFDDIMSGMTFWFDGYNFGKNNISDANNNVFNPVSVINALREFKFAGYWSNTQTATHIVQGMYEKGFDMKYFDNLSVHNFDLGRKYDVRNEIPLCDYMLHTGYLRITSYNNIENHTILQYPNYEIRTFLQFEIDEFIPGSANKISQQQEKLSQLHESLSAKPPNIEFAVEVLNELGFPNFKYPVYEDQSERDVITRRISLIFRFADIKHDNVVLQGNKSSTAGGDIDLYTTSLPINYAIEVKVGHKQTSYEQIIGYFTDKHKTFRDYIKYDDRIYLLSLNFSKGKNNQIRDWALIPCFGSQILQNETITSSVELLNSQS